jgi:hypothetical protein
VATKQQLAQRANDILLARIDLVNGLARRAARHFAMRCLSYSHCGECSAIVAELSTIGHVWPDDQGPAIKLADLLPGN